MARQVKHSPIFPDDQSQQIVQLEPAPTRVVNYAAPILEPAKVTAPPAPRVGTSFTSMCPAVDCNFDELNLCNYLTSKSTAPDGQSLQKWRSSSQGILNTLTGIPSGLGKTGGFLFAGGEDVSPKDTFILSTKTSFSLKESSRLDFFVYQAGIKGRLSVCLNTIDNCALTLDSANITSDAMKWIPYWVPVGPDTHAVHFVADRLQRNYAIGLDSIQLLNKFGTASVGC